MKNIRAKMFNSKAAAPENKPDQIIKGIDLKPGQNIADIGSGGGYYCLRFAKIVGENGRVFIIEYKKGNFLTFNGIFGHNIKKENIIKEMADAGYRLQKEYDFLPKQHFTVYSQSL